jgi:DNA-binding NarL/FixJ family response regulator
MIRLLVIDDHAVVRAGIKQFLADTPDIVIAGEAATADDAMRRVRGEEPWDAVLLDIALPGKSGVEVLKQIKRERPALPVLILSMHPESRYAVQLLRSGASGYLQKEAMPSELVRAIRIIVTGNKYVSAALAQLLASDLDASTQQPLHKSLSEREYQIFNRLAQGQSVSSIASELCLSAKTVSTYRTRVLEKMKLATNADLTYYAIKNDLLD